MVDHSGDVELDAFCSLSVDTAVARCGRGRTRHAGCAALAPSLPSEESMKRSSLLVALFVAVGCAHQASPSGPSVRVVVNASPQVARQFDVAALQHMTELAVSHVTLTNPR